jgi:hypothetical protein
MGTTGSGRQLSFDAAVANGNDLRLRSGDLPFGCRLALRTIRKGCSWLSGATPGRAARAPMPRWRSHAADKNTGRYTKLLTR